MNRVDLLETAIEITSKKHDEDYGTPNANFLRTARLWSAYIGYDIKPEDVAAMMVLMKVSRARSNPRKTRNWAGMAGYAGCGAEVCASKHDEPDEELDLKKENRALKAAIRALENER